MRDVQILEDNSTSEFISQVRASLSDDIIQANSIDVDGVSGATLSSNSLKRAIQEALGKAKSKRGGDFTDSKRHCRHAGMLE